MNTNRTFPVYSFDPDHLGVDGDLTAPDFAQWLVDRFQAVDGIESADFYQDDDGLYNIQVLAPRDFDIETLLPGPDYSNELWLGFCDTP